MEVINGSDSDGFVTLFIAHETSEWKSFFDAEWGEPDLARRLAEYNYNFYLYIFEQQQLGRCRIACDYSSGYHTMVNGMKIGVLKAYPVSPYFTQSEAISMARELADLLQEFDRKEVISELHEFPHTPRPMIFRS
jgi:hypothetical protein